MEHRLTLLERRLRRQQLLSFSILVLLVSVLASSFQSPDAEEQILRARGLVLVDDAGRERILLGAPVPHAANRIRTDPQRVRETWAGAFPDPDAYMELYAGYEHSTNGLLILDENGHDRVVVGNPTPDLYFGKRIGPATGITINDHKGLERTGYSLLDVDGTYRVVLGLDNPRGSEGLVLMLVDDGPTGMTIRKWAK